MGSLVVRYPGFRDVIVNGEIKGETNSEIKLVPGKYIISLEGDKDYSPEQQNIEIIAEIAAEIDSNPIFISFNILPPEINRFSLLYCRYNGLLLGQFLFLMHSQYARSDYDVRSSRLNEFLQEINVTVEIPEKPLDVFTESHDKWMFDIVTKVGELSLNLAEFALLGINLIIYGHYVKSNNDDAELTKSEINRLCLEHELPEPDLDTFIPEVTSDGIYLIDSVLSASLEYLALAIEPLETESDTAFVIMPFSKPYTNYFSIFYRPSLEGAGFRAIRAWGGLSQEDYCGLLLKLIQKSGMVWVDVSEPNNNVYYEVGAAHAFGRLAMIVRDETKDNDIAANIGHDSIIRYNPEENNFPEEAINDMTSMIYVVKAASKRETKVRIRHDSLVEAYDESMDLLMTIITPVEAYEAFDEAFKLYNNGDFFKAEQVISHGIKLGNSARNLFLRGLIRSGMGDHTAALNDFNESEKLGEDSYLLFDSRGINNYFLGHNVNAESDLSKALEYDSSSADSWAFRGFARVLLGKNKEALSDFNTAFEHGYNEVALHTNRAYALVRLNRLDEAVLDVEKARQLKPDDAWVYSASANTLLALEKYSEAEDELNKALMIEDAAALHFELGIAMLFQGRVDDAQVQYDIAISNANNDELKAAVRDLDFWRGSISSDLEETVNELMFRLLEEIN